MCNSMFRLRKKHTELVFLLPLQCMFKQQKKKNRKMIMTVNLKLTRNNLSNYSACSQEHVVPGPTFLSESLLIMCAFKCPL